MDRQMVPAHRCDCNCGTGSERSVPVRAST